MFPENVFQTFLSFPVILHSEFCSSAAFRLVYRNGINCLPVALTPHDGVNQV